MYINNNKIKKVLLASIVCCLLVQGPITLQTKVVEANTASQINVRSNVVAKLYDAQLVKDETGNMAVFTITINNQSNTTLNLIDYWAKLKGSNNKSYVTKLISSDMEKKYVIPKTTTYLTYYAYVDEKEQLSDLKLDIIEWDFGVSNYEKTIGTVKSNGSGITPYKKAEEININKTLLNILVNSYKMYSDKEHTYLTFDTAIRNKSNSVVDLNSISFYLNDGKGGLIELSGDKVSLKPQERKSITLNGVVTNSFVNNSLSIVVMYKDEGSTISIPKATLQLPKLSNTNVYQTNVETSYQFNGSSLALTMKESSISGNNNRSTLKTNLIIENKGTTKLDMPGLEYYVKTSEGFLYPLNITDTEQVTLLPKIKKQLELEGEIPKQLNTSTSQIVLFQKGAEGSTSNYLGSYKIKVGSAQEPTDNTSSSVKYKDMLIEQVTLQRTPSGVNDLLIAEFKITNTSKQGKGKLSIAGGFELDGVKLATDKTKIIGLDNLVAVSPGQSYKIVAYTEIPYIQEANKIVFRMNEKLEEETKDIHAFEVSKLSNARLLASNQAYQIDTLGNRADVSIQSYSIYNGNQTDLFVAKLKYVNKERRANLPTTLKAYIENSKQDIVELDIKNYTTKLLPDGELMLYVSAPIPKNYEDKRINLYFGEKIGGTEELEGVIINPVYVSNVVQQLEPAKELKNLEFMQYDASLSNFETLLLSSDGWTFDTINLNFDYDLKVRDHQPIYSDVENVIVEYVDGVVPSIKFSKTFAIADQTKEDSLEVGTKKSLSIKYVNPAINVINFNDYTINIYSEYKGHKKLIATKKFSFGQINN